MSVNKAISFINKQKNKVISCITIIRNTIFRKKDNIRQYDSKSVYADFAPIENLSQDEESLKALYWALNNPKITNIALTGPYGSGKSSIISSFCKLYPKFRAINISLATFDGNTWDKLYELCKKTNEECTQIDDKWLKDELERETKVDIKELEDELERGILKQLFYKVNADKIPLSRYRKLHHIKLHRYILGVLTALVVIGAIVYLVIPEKVSLLIEDYVTKCDSLFACLKLISAFVIALVGISYVVRFVMTKFTVKEISVGDASVQGGEVSTESVLNKNIDEMLYFFERTKYNVVFVEDLDRFKTTSIFTKLREINKILNQYEVIKNRIVFVYAVKDNLFEKEIERTKFFDFLIPVIPVVNSTNSGAKMRDLLRLDDKNGEYPEHNISEKFITLISPFIGDMRVLISIINEFWMYKRTLINGLKDQLDDECLLALIIYKNLYPKDFALLEAEAGDVKDAFENKKEAIKKARENLREKRKQLECKQKDVLKSLKELKIIILSEIIDNKGVVVLISKQGKEYEYSELLDDNFSFDILREGQIEVSYRIYDESRTRNLNPIKNLEESNEKFIELFSRYDAQCAFIDKTQEEVLIEFEKIDRDIMQLRANTLQQLIENNPEEEVLPVNVRKNDLLVFLLRHGYINENYANYINYFHPGSISKEELNFILSVRNHRSLEDFAFSIKHCENVCEKLYDYEFEQPEVLNFDLLDFLLNSKVKENKLQRLVKQIINRSALSRGFIKAYVERNKNVEHFLHILCHESGHIWEDIVNDEQLSNETKDKYFKLIIVNCDIEDICKNDYMCGEAECGGIRQYFENDKDILSKLSDVSISQIKNLINALDIQFYELNVEGTDLAVIDFIIEERHYVLNPHMMKAIFQIKNPECMGTLFCANYHCIRELGCKDLLDYVYEDFPSYVQKFILDIESNTEEMQDDVEDIIEHLLVTSSTDMCIDVIKKEHLAYWEKLTTCLKGYSDEAKRKIWDYLIVNKRIGLSWDNFLTYHNIYGLTSDLYIYMQIII